MCRLGTRWARRPLWFESSDAALRPAPEALAAVSHLPALQRGARVVLDEPLDPDFRSALARLSEIHLGWWPLRGAPPPRSPRAPVREAVAEGPTALCFTGGVDSFHGLLRGPGRVDVLLFVHGYDIPLEDEARMRAWSRSLRAIAAACGSRAIVMRTNLRAHRAFRRVNWEWSHGPALAAAGMLLGETAARLRISSSYAREHLRPWGSHPETDPLWSTPWLRVEHWGEGFLRIQKLAAIASEPLVQRHLRVCHENLSESGNCAQCEKCLRTMTALAGLGHLDAFEAFDRSLPLARRLGSLSGVPPHLRFLWRQMLDLELPDEVRAQVERLGDGVVPDSGPAPALAAWSCVE